MLASIASAGIVNRRSFAAFIVGFGLLSVGCGSRELTADQVAGMLRDAPQFTNRRGSAVRREVVEVLVVRPIGARATEAEFTWKNVPGDGTLKTSMALFRMNKRQWTLDSLYKVD